MSPSERKSEYSQGAAQYADGRGISPPFFMDTYRKNKA